MSKWANIYYKNEGYSITIPLSQFKKGEKYMDYSVSCQYQYKKEQEKYSLSMWLMRNDIDEKFDFSHQEVDTQYISGTRETIRENICRIVEQAMSVNFFDKYIDRFEYEIKCCDKGNEFFDHQESGAA